LAAPAAHDVTLAGSFNGWSAGIPLRKSAVSGLWVVTLPLPVGEHQYLFHVDGNQWIPDPGAHAQVDDGFGRTNSVLVVGPRGVAGP
jgi:1,4-alpha-glucan branching enzyme